MGTYNVELRARVGASFPDTYYPKANWNNMDNKPTTFVPSAHTHPEYRFHKTGWDRDVQYTGAINGSRLVTLTPSGTIKYWIDGTEYTVLSNRTVTIPNTSGIHYIYFVGSTLTTSMTPWPLDNTVVPVMIVVWNATTQTAALVGHEAHTWIYDDLDHEATHKTKGTAYAKGGAVTIESTTTISVGAVEMWDEDLKLESGVNVGIGQVLDILSAPIIYRSGALPEMVRTTDSTATCLIDGVPQVNLFNGSTWNLVDVGLNKYFCYWLAHTNDYTDSFMWIPGQVDGDNLADALNDNKLETLKRDELDAPELVVVGRLTMQRSGSGYVIEQWDDYRKSSSEAATINLEAHTHSTNEITGLTTAITDEIDAAIAALVDSSPGTLDTLNELAAALGDDPNFATTITNALAGKLSLSEGGTIVRSTPGDALRLEALPTETDISLHMGLAGESNSFKLKYWGTGAGNANAFSIESSTATLLRSNQDGIVNFPNGLTLGGTSVSVEGHTHDDKASLTQSGAMVFNQTGWTASGTTPRFSIKQNGNDIFQINANGQGFMKAFSGISAKMDYYNYLGNVYASFNTSSGNGTFDLKDSAGTSKISLTARAGYKSNFVNGLQVGGTDVLVSSDISAWAKAATKPSYAYSEITSAPSYSLVGSTLTITI